MRRCACPSPSRVDCVEARYLATREEALMEPCECLCHDEVGAQRESGEPWWKCAGCGIEYEGKYAPTLACPNCGEHVGANVTPSLASGTGEAEPSGYVRRDWLEKLEEKQVRQVNIWSTSAGDCVPLYRHPAPEVRMDNAARRLAIDAIVDEAVACDFIRVLAGGDTELRRIIRRHLSAPEVRAPDGEPDDDDRPACPVVHASGYPCETRGGHKGDHMAIGDEPGQVWWWSEAVPQQSGGEK